LSGSKKTHVVYYLGTRRVLGTCSRPTI